MNDPEPFGGKLGQAHPNGHVDHLMREAIRKAIREAYPKLASL